MRRPLQPARGDGQASDASLSRAPLARSNAGVGCKANGSCSHVLLPLLVELFERAPPHPAAIGGSGAGGEGSSPAPLAVAAVHRLLSILPAPLLLAIATGAPRPVARSFHWLVYPTPQASGTLLLTLLRPATPQASGTLYLAAMASTAGRSVA